MFCLHLHHSTGNHNSFASCNYLLSVEKRPIGLHRERKFAHREDWPTVDCYEVNPPGGPVPNASLDFGGVYFGYWWYVVEICSIWVY